MCIRDRSWDHIGIFTTFIFMPLTMLGGVFWSVSWLPHPWGLISKFNPVYWMVNGLRYAMLDIVDENFSFVDPFDDLDIHMGQGTVALEVINEVKNLDYAFVSIGGGGLIAGMACVLKQINPKIKIIGVEPINSNVMTNSIKSGKPEIFDTINNKTIADTLAAPFAGKITFEYVKEYVDDIINVSEDEMIESLRMMIERLKIVPEPSASACFVPIVFNKLNVPSKSKCLVVVCGGNIDLKRIKSLF